MSTPEPFFEIVIDVDTAIAVVGATFGELAPYFPLAIAGTIVWGLWL